MAGTNLGQAYVQIVPSAKGIKGSIQKVLSPEADTAGASAGKKIGNGVKRAIGALGIGTAISAAIMEGGKLEQSIGGIETLFKDSADTMIKNANNAFETAGLSANEYMETATSFSASLLKSVGGDTKKAADYANRAIIDMSDNANKMGSNMEDIQNAYQGFAKQNYTMLDNLKLGYGGTKTEMEKLIKDASEMTDIQDKLNVKVDEGDLSFGNIVNAISVMQESLDIAGTTSKEAATTLEGSFNSMKAAAKNVLGSLVIGENVEGAMKGLVSSASSFLLGNLIPAVIEIGISLPGALISGIEEAWPSIETGVSDLMDKLEDKLKAPIENVKNFCSEHSDLFTGIAVALGTLTAALIAYNGAAILATISSAAETAALVSMYIAEGVTTVATTLLGAAVSFLTSPITLVVLAIGALTAAGILLYKNWDKVKAKAKELASVVGEKFSRLKEKVTGIFSSLREKVVNTWTRIKEAITKPVTSAVERTRDLVGRLKERVIGIFDSLKERVGNTWGRIKEAITRPVTSAVEKVRNAISRIKSFFNIGLRFKSIKLPHISVDWKAASGIKGKVLKAIGLEGLPSFSVNWYAKGGIFNEPTIAGIGEAGPEAVVPLGKLWDNMHSFAEAVVSGLTPRQGGGTLFLSINLDGETIGQTVVEYKDGQSIEFGTA